MLDLENAILNCRATVRDFVDGTSGYPTFRERMDAAMESFDPLDASITRLPKHLQSEAAMYSDWLGGEFGETDDRIPKRTGWVYGDSTAPYEWVDVDAYRERLKEAFGHLLA